MSELARKNGWHGFDSIGDKVPGGYEYLCDGMPTSFGCGETLTITRKLARVGQKRSGWLVMYGAEENDRDDVDVVLTFCPECAKVVRAQQEKRRAEKQQQREALVENARAENEARFARDITRLLEDARANRTTRTEGENNHA
ncbi:hypothetical protein ACFY9N_11770 [Microbacterium sp. NPDC008134]|uniref:hypothetical protein n=1 Tax=Microbacterium sp. NPDC008134 TaxID=3364183 RepID=UPI0036E73CA8